jgi:hypothetical protein
VANNGSASGHYTGNVSAFAINPRSGALTPVQGSPFAAGTNPLGVAISPNGKFAYVVNYNSANVSVFAINASTGALKQVKGSPFSVRHFPTAEAIDPTGKFAYVTHEDSEPYQHDGHIDGYGIDKRGGALRTLKGTRKETGDVPAGVAIDPSGKFVYVVNYASQTVSAFAITASTGALSNVQGSPFAAATSLLESRRARSSMTDAFRRHCSIRRAAGDCDDRAGNVFITDEFAGTISKYAHGGTNPTLIISNVGRNPYGCSVDPKSGDLSVVSFGTSPWGGVFIYKKAKRSVTEFADPSTYNYYYCGYDNNGNLFVEGSNYLHQDAGLLAELPKGGSAFETVTLSNSFSPGGGVQWDGTDLALESPNGRHNTQGPTVIDRVQISGSTGTMTTPVYLSTNRKVGWQQSRALSPAPLPAGAIQATSPLSRRARV